MSGNKRAVIVRTLGARRDAVTGARAGVKLARKAGADLDFAPSVSEVYPDGFCTSVREPDGLAMSSRNVHLDPTDRARAVALISGLRAIETTAQAVGLLVETGSAAMTEYGLEPEYLAGVDPVTLAPVAQLGARTLFVTAARVGPVRLIDNLLVRAHR